MRWRDINRPRWRWRWRAPSLIWRFEDGVRPKTSRWMCGNVIPMFFWLVLPYRYQGRKTIQRSWLRWVGAGKTMERLQRWTQHGGFSLDQISSMERRQHLAPCFLFPCDAFRGRSSKLDMEPIRRNEEPIQPIRSKFYCRKILHVHTHAPKSKGRPKMVRHSPFFIVEELSRLPLRFLVRSSKWSKQQVSIGMEGDWCKLRYTSEFQWRKDHAVRKQENEARSFRNNEPGLHLEFLWLSELEE